MRKLIIAAAVLVSVGLVLLWSTRDEAPRQAPAVSADPAGAGEQARATRAGTTLQPVSAEDEGARGTASAGSTPALTQAPSEKDGVLEVEVLAGTRPVPGASVRLYWRGTIDPNLNEVSWRLASEGATDASGLARLASRPGAYLVAVRAPGYAPLRRDVVRPYGEARTQLKLTVEPGQTLTGRTVARGTQEPVPLVELVLTAHGRKLEPWQLAAAPAEERAYASSDGRGNFRVDGLAPGTYLLEARAPGHATTFLNSVQVPAAEPVTVALQLAGVIEGFVVDAQGNPASGAEVQVSGVDPQVATTGEGGGFSVEVAPGAHTVTARRGNEAAALDKRLVVSAGKTVRDVRLRLGAGAAVEGRVTAQATEAPVAGASVDVSPHGSSGDSGRTVTDEAGRFSVSGLAPGSYDVVVTAAGFATLTRGGLTVSEGERFSVELELSGTGAVAGVVRDGAGQPLQGIQVVGGNRWGGALGTIPAESRTDAEGRYRLEGLSPGLLTVSARREGSQLGTGQRVEVREGRTEQVDLVVDEPGVVEGVVRAAQGSLPSEPLFVTAYSRVPRRSGAPDMARQQVEAGGNFRMTLPPDTYSLMVTRQVRGGFRGRSSGASNEVRIEAGKTAKVELLWQQEQETGPTIRGIVLEPDGAPSVSAVVSYSSEEAGLFMPATEFTDEQGRFSLSLPPESAPMGVPSPRPGVTQGRMKVSAKNGGRTGEVLGVRAGEQSVVVRLKPGLPVRGRVVRATPGEPVKGFTLSLEPQSRQSFWMRGLNELEFANDRFELRDVPATPVKLVARTSDGALGEALVTPGSEQPGEVLITVMQSASVTGRVIDSATGKPVAEAFVYLEGRRPSGPPNNTLSNGVFRLDQVPLGEHTVVIRAGSAYMSERRTVKLVEGQTFELGDITVSTSRAPTLPSGGASPSPTP